MKYEVTYVKDIVLNIVVEAKNEIEARGKADTYLESKAEVELINESQEGDFEHQDTEEVEQ